MKIGIDGRMWGYSGIGRYIKNLVSELIVIDKRNQYFLFVQRDLDSRQNYDLASRPNLKIIKVDAPIYSFREQIRFLRAINKQKLDLMHFTHFNLPILYFRPFVVTIHDLTPLYFPGRRYRTFFKQRAYLFILKTALRKSAKIIVVSHYTKKDLLRNFPFLEENKIQVIYEGVEEVFKIPKSKSQTGLSSSKLRPYLLYVGVWREHKNITGLIKAFEKVKCHLKGQARELKNLKLVLVGKPDPLYSEVAEMARKSPFQKDIFLKGYVSDLELVNFYQNASVFVFPSLYEGFGLPPLEAMSFGCPVVCSKVTSLPEILDKAALYFDPYDIDKMAERILKCLTDGDLRKKLIGAGQKQIKNYSFKKMAKETLRLYKELKTEE